MAPFLAFPALLLPPPDRPALGDLVLLVLPAGRLAEGPQQQAGGDADLAPDRHVDGMELAQQHRVPVDLDGRLLRRDAGVVAEAGAEDDQAVGLVHEVARHRRAAAPEDATAERMAVRDESLRLERRDHRTGEPLGQLHDAGHVEARPVADDDRRPA